MAAEDTEAPQLAEVLNQEASLSTEIELKVIRNQIMDYTYTWQGKTISTQKLQIVLQSKIPEQYCLGVAKLQKANKAELKQMEQRWKTDTEWKFQSLAFLNEKTAYIHTTCRIVIDLRKSKACAQLQSTSFPPTPVPTVTIADVLQLKQLQRFDLMAVTAKIIEERKSGTGIYIADVRLIDGSKKENGKATEYASLPLSLFFKDASELTRFKQYLGGKPLLFMCLQGSVKENQLSVAPIKNQSWWQEATGPKALTMANETATLCDEDVVFQDVASLQTFTANANTDYINTMATLTTCQAVDPTCASPASLLGDTTEHLYQLNHVYVTLPSKESSIKTKDDRLFARFDVWDFSKKISLWFRSKACFA